MQHPKVVRARTKELQFFLNKNFRSEFVRNDDRKTLVKQARRAYEREVRALDDTIPRTPRRARRSLFLSHMHVFYLTVSKTGITERSLSHFNGRNSRVYVSV